MRDNFDIILFMFYLTLKVLHSFLLKMIYTGSIDDHQITRGGISSLVAGQDDMHELFSLGTGQAFLDNFEELTQELTLLLLDIELRDISGLEILYKIKKKKNEIKVVIFTGHHNSENYRIARAGQADGFISKVDEPDFIITAIRKVARGEKVYSDHIIARDEADKQPDLLYDIKLTESQTELIRLLCMGYTSPKIAEILKNSRRTVETRRERLKDKIGSNKLADIIYFARFRGII